jgi:AcrR family transcriptional regulator
MAGDRVSRGVAGLDSGATIRDAALRRFAAHGVAGTTMRVIAGDAGVSLGLVQHRFGTKERLVEAVDQYVLDVVRSRLALDDSHGRRRATEESVEDTGRRVLGLVDEYPAVVDYLARAMIDDAPIGAQTFDALFAIGRLRWGSRADKGELQADVGGDVVWAAMNPLLLTLGTIILRRHVERQLPEPFSAPAQLKRWESSVSALLRHGQMR